MLGERKVNLFIAGAAKSGTTTLYSCLNGHPQVCMCSIKEPNYFTSEVLKDEKLYYREPILSTYPEYSRCFKPSPDQPIIGEASVSYLFYPGTAKKIYDYNPDAKILMVLRNPVERAYSHFLMDRKLGYVKDSFKDIWQSSARLPMTAHFRQYFEYGLYCRQVKEYLEVFPSHQNKILWFDELAASLPAVLNEISGFLSIGSFAIKDQEKKENESGMPVGKAGAMIYRQRMLRKLAKRFVPRLLAEKIKQELFHALPEALPAGLKNQLIDFYRKDIADLELLTGKKLTNWYE